MAMASTTKIMTCILALENGQEQTVATASAKAAAAPKVHLGVREGEQFLLGDLLYSLMLESHNDAAVMIAETIGGSVEEFASLMNEKAAAIGCTDTHFVTPNGLDASDAGGDHHTTAADLATDHAILCLDFTESRPVSRSDADAVLYLLGSGKEKHVQLL